MKEYSNTEIEGLIKCCKKVIEPPKRRMRSERGSLRNDFKLESPEYEGEFMVFLRVNEQFPENFSIGLEYLPKEEKGAIILIRCNGTHGPYVENAQGVNHHASFHIHRARSENIAAGFKSERGGIAASEYACFEEALKYFLREINVEAPENYFPGLNQMVFNFMNSGEP